MPGEETITGGCLCGAIRYEAAEEPITTATCHCRMCQKAYGGPFTAGVAFRKSAIRLTKGDLKYYKSSKIAKRGFCSICGSPIMLDLEPFVPVHGENVFVRLGSLDDSERYRPEFHYGVEGQLPWVHFDDGLSREITEEDPAFIEALAAAEAQNRT